MHLRNFKLRITYYKKILLLAGAAPVGAGGEKARKECWIWDILKELERVKKNGKTEEI